MNDFNGVIILHEIASFRSHCRSELYPKWAFDNKKNHSNQDYLLASSVEYDVLLLFQILFFEDQTILKELNRKQSKMKSRHWIIYSAGLFCGIITLLVKAYADKHPVWIESWYGNGVFVQIRHFWDSWHHWIPIPLLYVTIALLTFWAVRIIWKSISHIIRDKWKAVIPILIKILGFLGIVVTGFYWFWGFNYSREKMATRANLILEGLNKEEILEEYSWVTDQIKQLTDSMPIEVWRENNFQYEETLEQAVRQGVQSVLNDFHIPNGLQAPITFVRPKGTLLRISTAGFYWPFTGESHVDGGMYPLQWPHVIAHELFHAYGITDEGECNFLAFLACNRSGDVRVLYSGLVGYWQYVASDARFHLREEYENLREALPASFRKDVRTIYQYLDKYPDILPKVRNVIYNSYLKSQGIHEGMKSYNQVVMLHYAWRNHSNRLYQFD